MSKISKQRKITYYIGIGMVVLGFILFLSVFFIAFNISNEPFSDKLPPMQNSVIGIVLIISGSFVMKIGARGAAGAGLVLDPEKEREDMKPFNEAKGGMINDVISNIDVINDLTSSLSKSTTEKEIIKIRCISCDALNDEDAKFCKSCGKEIW